MENTTNNIENELNFNKEMSDYVSNWECVAPHKYVKETDKMVFSMVVVFNAVKFSVRNKQTNEIEMVSFFQDRFIDINEIKDVKNNKQTIISFIENKMK